MEGIPMDPEHHRQMRIGRCTGGASDVEVETFELGLAQVLVGNAVFRQVEDLLFNALEFWLGAYWPARHQYLSRRSQNMGRIPKSRAVCLRGIVRVELGLAEAGGDGGKVVVVRWTNTKGWVCKL